MSLKRLFLIEAAEILARSKRGELVDDAFGDAEVWWKDETGAIIAEGHFGSRSKSVSFDELHTPANPDGYEPTTFNAEKAQRLRYLGAYCEYQSNNSDVCLIRDSEDKPWRRDPLAPVTNDD